MFVEFALRIAFWTIIAFVNGSVCDERGAQPLQRLGAFSASGLSSPYDSTTATTRFTFRRAEGLPRGHTTPIMVLPNKTLQPFGTRTKRLLFITPSAIPATAACDCRPLPLFDALLLLRLRLRHRHDMRVAILLQCYPRALRRLRPLVGCWRVVRSYIPSFDPLLRVPCRLPAL